MPHRRATPSAIECKINMEVGIAIIGGGLSGLALAAGLCARGWDAHVFEANKNGLRTASSTMIQLGGNAFCAVEWLHPDIVPQLKAVGSQRLSVVQHSRSSPTEELVRQQNTFTHEGYGLRWSEVQNVLAGLVPPEAVHCGYRATGYTEQPEEGRVRIHFQDQPDVHARLAVAADGVRSALRATMIPNDPGPRYLGDMNWNAIIHNPEGRAVKAHDLNQVTVYSLGDTFELSPLRVFVSDAGGGWTFWQVRVSSEQPSFTLTPPKIQTKVQAEVIDTDKSDLLDGKVKANDQMGGSTTHSDTSQATDQVTDQYMLDTRMAHLVGGGLGRPGSKARLEKMLAEAGFETPLRCVQATPESAIFERVMLDRVPLDELGANMYSPGHRVVLTGDAAHAMHANPSQGGRTAMEDACTLAMLLEQQRDQLAACGWSIKGRADNRLQLAAPYKQSNGTSANSKGMSTCADGTASQLQHGLKVSDAAILASDEGLLADVVSGYQEQRLVRVCRVARFAAEACGLTALRNKLRPEHLTKEQRQTRFQELTAWLAQYPDNPNGDPNSTYWKPPACDSAVDISPALAAEPANVQ